MAGPSVGESAPEIDLPWTEGGAFRLSDHRGRWVVLAFYPGDFTPTCSRQLRSYGDLDGELDRLDALLVGISPQGIDSHERFIAGCDLTMPLVADEELTAASAYGVKAPGFVRRAVFVVDPTGTVRFRDTKLLGLSHLGSDDLLEALEQARAAVESIR
jgi:thioredoxin-dependent peroxiredoxin